MSSSLRKVAYSTLIAISIGFIGISGCKEHRETPSPYELKKTHDSLYHLNDFRLPYPVYRFCTGDIDGDGQPEALVGVIKPTRYYPEKGKRLFIFHLVDGQLSEGRKSARPLWLGSKLGGILYDFRYIEGGTVRSLEATADSQFVVAEYRWKGFGMAFQRFLVKNTDHQNALNYFNH
jgi:hypothetical protein